MNELTKIRIKDNLTGDVYRLIGFEVGGDDRSGFPVTKLELYNDSARVRITITNPQQMKRLSVIIE